MILQSGTISPPVTSYATPAICAVMVSHRPEADIIDNLELLTEQEAIDRIILVENGTTVPSAILEPVIAGKYGEKPEIIACADNNLAMAQNIGIHAALRQKYEWILLLDDDSKPHPDMLREMLKFWQSLNEDERAKVGIIAPNIVNEGTEQADKFARLWARLFFYKSGFTSARTGSSASSLFSFADSIRNILYVPASGSLIPASVFAAVGYMDESLNIYFVDVDFCLRLRRAGYDIIAVKNAIMKHRMGERKSHHVMGIRITTTNHSPRARYFMYRNRLRLWQRYFMSFPGYVFFDLLRCGYELLRIATLENNRKEKLCAILYGITGREKITDEQICE